MRMQIIPDAPYGHTWEGLMHRALDEARRGKKLDEVPVGALIIHKDGEILALSHNRTRIDCDPTAHAEILAIRESAKKISNFRLLDCYLIVTLEPCIMCLGALREARIGGIIFGAYDNEVGAVSSMLEGAELDLHNPKPWFMGGVLEDECKEVLQDFFRKKRK